MRTRTRTTTKAPGADESPGADRHDSYLFGRGLLYVIVWSLQLIAATVISPVLAHVLSVSEFGALASAIALYQLLSVLVVLGLDRVVVLQRSGSRDPASARGLVAFGIAMSLVLAAAIGVTSPLWLGALGFGAYPGLVRAVVLWTAAAGGVQVILALLLAEDRIRPFALVSCLSAVGGQAFGIVLLITVRDDATTYAWGGVISQFAALAVGILIARPSIRGLGAWRVTWRSMKLGVPLAAGALCYFVLNAGDRVIIQRFLGPGAVGRYQVAYVVGSLVIVLLTFTSSAWTPRFASVLDVVERTELAIHSRNQLYRLLVPALLGVMLAAPIALRVVAPPSYDPATLLPVVFIVALSCCPVAASAATGQLLLVERRGRALALAAAVAAAGNIALNIVLVPRIGIVGSALATLFAYMLLALFQRFALPATTAWRAAPLGLIVGACTTAALSGATMLLPQTTGWNIARLAVGLACLPWFFRQLRRARSRTESEVRPMERASRSVPQAPPEPTRIVNIDLDQPLPDLTDASTSAPGGFPRAMVIAWRDGAPVGQAIVEVRSGAALIEQQLSRLARSSPRDRQPERSLRSTDESRSRPDPDPRRGQPPGEDELPPITVVVSTIVQRTDDLGRLLESLNRLDYPDAEFLIVDNRRTVPEHDVLPALTAICPRARLVRAARPGLSAGRNAGIEAARHDIIAFTDDDVRVDPNWLRAIGRRFAEEPALEAVTGMILPAELETPAQIWFERYYGGFGGPRTFAPVTLRAEPGRRRILRNARISALDRREQPIRTFAIYGVGAYAAGANMAFRRAALERRGGFDLALGAGTRSRGGEDLQMLISILWSGGRVGYEPAAAVHHRHRREFSELLEQLRGNGVGFTATLTALILADPRHLVSLGWQAPHAVSELIRTRISTSPEASSGAGGPSRPDPYPRVLMRTELLNYARGPFSYARARWAGRALPARAARRSAGRTVGPAASAKAPSP